MEQKRKDKIIDYFPLLAYFAFWLQGAAISAVMTGELKLIVLGAVTTPALTALVLAALKIQRQQKKES